MQRPVAQSVPLLQVLPLAHGSHVPPQSTAVSDPFLIVSEHVGIWQTSESHLPLAQSFAPVHPEPVAQGGNCRLRSPRRSRVPSLTRFAQVPPTAASGPGVTLPSCA